MDAIPDAFASALSLSRISEPSPASACCTCHHRNNCLPNGLGAGELRQLQSIVVSGKRVAEDRHLYRGEDAGRYIFVVKTGAFKTVLVSPYTGQRKVTGFYLPGDILGIEVLHTQRYAHDAVALEDSVACFVPTSVLGEGAATAGRLSRSLLRALSAQAWRDGNVLELLGALNAEQRVAAFLLNLGIRYSWLGYDPLNFYLKMSREEIGSYLGLTMETVSRILSKLAMDGCIAVERKKIQIRDSDRLRAGLGF